MESETPVDLPQARKGKAHEGSSPGFWEQKCSFQCARRLDRLTMDKILMARKQASQITVRIQPSRWCVVWHVADAQERKLCPPLVFLLCWGLVPSIMQNDAVGGEESDPGILETLFARVGLQCSRRGNAGPPLVALHIGRTWTEKRCSL